MFGAKKNPTPLPTENSSDSKKPLIWRFFTLSEKDKSRAMCNSCGGIYSLGSDKLY
jgi:hypothetical protein